MHGRVHFIALMHPEKCMQSQFGRLFKVFWVFVCLKHTMHFLLALPHFWHSRAACRDLHAHNVQVMPQPLDAFLFI